MSKCENKHFFLCETIKFHIIFEVFAPLYNTRYYYGERTENERDVQLETGHGEQLKMMLNDAFMQEVEDDSMNPVRDNMELCRFE